MVQIQQPKPLFSDLFQVEEDSFEKILITLLDKENITMKTDIKNPLNLIKLKTLANLLRIEGLIEEANLIDNFITGYLEYMVSYNRQSRKEIIQALSEGLKEERTVGEKLMSKEKT